MWGRGLAVGKIGIGYKCEHVSKTNKHLKSKHTNSKHTDSKHTNSKHLNCKHTNRQQQVIQLCRELPTGWDTSQLRQPNPSKDVAAKRRFLISPRTSNGLRLFSVDMKIELNLKCPKLEHNHKVSSNTYWHCNGDHF